MKDNKILKLAFVLLVICAVTAGILGVVNALTAQRIYDMAHAKEFEAYAVVLESSSGYSELSFDKEAFPTVDSIMSSNDGNGYVVKSTFSDAQGSITMVCSVDNDRRRQHRRPDRRDDHLPRHHRGRRNQHPGRQISGLRRAERMNRKKQFTEGLITNNPVLVQQIGMCSTMAITTTLFNGVGMGLSVLIILTCCNVVVAALRSIIPEEIRLAIFVVVIAGFVTIVDLLLQAYIPALSAALGVFIPLIVVNCIIIGRAEAFCQKHSVKDSFFDGIFQGLGYTVVLIIMCVFREFVGSGRFGGGLIDIANGFRFTLDGTGGGIQIFPADYGMGIMNLPFGGFLTLGLLIGLMQYALKKGEKKKKLEERAAKEAAAMKEVEE